MPLRLMITGGAGFLGARVARRAAADGHEVLAVARQAAPLRLADHAGISYRSVDLTHEGGLLEVARGWRPHVVVHCAAPGVVRSETPPGEVLAAVNVAMASEVARAARGAGAAVVWIGSCFEYAPSSAPVDEAWPLEPQSPYGLAKQAGWLAFQRMAGEAIPWLILRSFHLYGPGEDRRRLVPTALLAPTGRAQNAFGDPALIRDLVFVDDAAEAVFLAARALAQGAVAPRETFNVSSGTAVSIGEVTRVAAEVAGVPGFAFGFRGQPPLAGHDPPYLVGDPARIRRALGWTAVTSLLSGLTRTRSTLEGGP